jgi:hypothetical protein
MGITTGIMTVICEDGTLTTSTELVLYASQKWKKSYFAKIMTESPNSNSSTLTPLNGTRLFKKDEFSKIMEYINMYYTKKSLYDKENFATKNLSFLEKNSIGIPIFTKKMHYKKFIQRKFKQNLTSFFSTSQISKASKIIIHMGGVIELYDYTGNRPAYFIRDRRMKTKEQIPFWEYVVQMFLNDTAPIIEDLPPFATYNRSKKDPIFRCTQKEKEDFKKVFVKCLKRSNLMKSITGSKINNGRTKFDNGHTRGYTIVFTKLNNFTNEPIVYYK